MTDNEKRRKPGRPKGKHSNPDYVTVSGYITKATFRRMRLKCFEQDLEVSELLQTLIDRWLDED